MNPKNSLFNRHFFPINPPDNVNVDQLNKFRIIEVWTKDEGQVQDENMLTNQGRYKPQTEIIIHVPQEKYGTLNHPLYNKIEAETQYWSRMSAEQRYATEKGGQQAYCSNIIGHTRTMEPARIFKNEQMDGYDKNYRHW